MRSPTRPASSGCTAGRPPRCSRPRARAAAARAGPGPAQVEALRRFGLELGLAFQIVDDVLDETGTAASLGKTPGKDRDEGKMTYVALYGVEGARQRARARLASAVTSLASLPDGAGLEALARYVVERDH